MIAEPAPELGLGLRPRDYVFILGAWTLVSLFNSEQTYVTLAIAGRNYPWLRVFGYTIPATLLWAALTPPIMWLTIRFPLDRRGIPVHLIGAILAAGADASLYNLIDPYISPFGTRTLAVAYVRYLSINFTNYFGIVAITLVTRYARLLRERQVAAAELRSQLTTAHLRSLQAQLRPHFLFNTLNTVAELVHRDPEAADRMIARLGALLRRSFDTFADQEVSLETELEFLHDYSEIVAARFQGRISISVDVDPDAIQARVPSLILQPLVENAVRHGLEPKTGGGSVEIVVRRRLDVLEFEVRDDGCGLPREDAAGSPAWREGVGLRNTADRLRHLYGDAHRFSVRARVTGGTIVAMQIPFSVAARTAVTNAEPPSQRAVEMVRS